MSPTLYNEKLFDGRAYDRVAYTRELLQKAGAPPEKTTDAYINTLWDMREVLVRMHRERGMEQKLMPGTRLLEFTKLLA